MSLFRPVTLTCPACAAPVKFQAVGSVNADRRPDLREAILNGTFQREACSKCKTAFRLDPEFNYLDVGRGQWIAVFPVARLSTWDAVEQDVKATFARAYGAQASPVAQEIGQDLQVRLTFGWSAVREKILANEKGIDDVSLELLKAALLQHADNVSIVDDNELRLVDVQDDTFVMAWIRSDSEELLEATRVPRELYDEIVADASDQWRGLRNRLTEGEFVDIQRLLIQTVAQPAP